MQPFPSPSGLTQAIKQAIVEHNRRYPDQRFPKCAATVIEHTIQQEYKEHADFIRETANQT